MFLKPNFLAGATLILFISWLGLELFYFSPMKLEIQKIIQNRIKLSNTIASTKINTDNFPQVSVFLQANIMNEHFTALKNSPDEAGEYFTQSGFFLNPGIKSINMDSSKLEMDKKILFYTVHFENSDIASIETLFNSISKNPKILNLEGVELQFAGIKKRIPQYRLNLNVSLPFFLESHLHETPSL